MMWEGSARYMRVYKIWMTRGITDLLTRSWMMFHLRVTAWKVCCRLNCGKRVQTMNKAWSMWLPGPVLSDDWATEIVALAGREPSESEFWVVGAFRLFERDLGRNFFNWRLIAIDENKRQVNLIDCSSHTCLLHRASRFSCRHGIPHINC